MSDSQAIRPFLQVGYSRDVAIIAESVRREMRATEGFVLSGKCQSYEKYRECIGRLAGLQAALDLLINNAETE